MRDIKGPLPVRVRVRFRLSGILSSFPFADILFSSILSSGILSGIRFGLHRGSPRATTSVKYKVRAFYKIQKCTYRIQ